MHEKGKEKIYQNYQKKNHSYIAEACQLNIVIQTSNYTMHYPQAPSSGKRSNSHITLRKHIYLGILSILFFQMKIKTSMATNNF